MAARRKKREAARERRGLSYPAGELSPDLFLTFVQFAPFTREWDRLGLKDDDLRALETAIMADPQGAPIVQGTGGVRKLRFTGNHWKGGKRSGVRVCYCYFEQHGIVTLLTVYGKGVQDSLTATQKRQLKALIREIEDYLRGSPKKK